MNILLIEDDIQLNVTITKYFKLKNLEIISIFDGELAISTIEKINFDIYIIDINLPHINGLDIIKYIREKDLESKIIIITASLELTNLQKAFDYGCDEYIKKPFYLEELEIRINNLLSHKKNPEFVEITNNMIFYFKTDDLIIDNNIIKLRKKQKRLLSILIHNANKTVTTEEIERYVWENEIKESYPLRQLVNQTKYHFKDKEKFIFADKGIGYRFKIN